MNFFQSQISDAVEIISFLIRLLNIFHIIVTLAESFSVVQFLTRRDRDSLIFTFIIGLMTSQFKY